MGISRTDDQTLHILFVEDILLMMQAADLLAKNATGLRPSTQELSIDTRERFSMNFTLATRSQKRSDY